jgi:DNA-binding transcriptional LysR family regulator
MIESVISHGLDGAFVCGPIDHPDLEQHAVFQEELVVATAPGRQRFEGLKEGGELKILVKGPGCAYRQRFEDMLQRDGIGVSRMEFGTLDALIGCVAAGLGETLLPRSVLASALREQRVAAHSLPAVDARVETMFIRRRDAFTTSALTAFLQRATGLRALASAAE